MNATALSFPHSFPVDIVNLVLAKTDGLSLCRLSQTKQRWHYLISVYVQKKLSEYGCEPIRIKGTQKISLGESIRLYHLKDNLLHLRYVHTALNIDAWWAQFPWSRLPFTGVRDHFFRVATFADGKVRTDHNELISVRTGQTVAIFPCKDNGQWEFNDSLWVEGEGHVEVWELPSGKYLSRLDIPGTIKHISAFEEYTLVLVQHETHHFLYSVPPDKTRAQKLFLPDEYFLILNAKQSFGDYAISSKHRLHVGCYNRGSLERWMLSYNLQVQDTEIFCSAPPRKIVYPHRTADFCPLERAHCQGLDIVALDHWYAWRIYNEAGEQCYAETFSHFIIQDQALILCSIQNKIVHYDLDTRTPVFEYPLNFSPNVFTKVIQNHILIYGDGQLAIYDVSVKEITLTKTLAIDPKRVDKLEFCEEKLYIGQAQLQILDFVNATSKTTEVRQITSNRSKNVKMASKMIPGQDIWQKSRSYRIPIAFALACIALIFFALWKRKKLG